MLTKGFWVYTLILFSVKKLEGFVYLTYNAPSEI
jgi:hypothetical protein